MTSYTIPYKSPRRRRPYESDLHDSSGSSVTLHHHVAISSSASSCTAIVEPPNLLKGRKLAFDEDRSHIWRQKANRYAGSNNPRRFLKPSALMLLMFSSLQMFWWRAPLLSFLTENRKSREQEMDAWSLLQKDLVLLRKREAKGDALYKENKMKAARIGTLTFEPIPKLRRKPLQFELSPNKISELQSSSRVVRLDETAQILPNKKELQPWIYHNTTISEISEDESDKTRSQTVVYDNDKECIPMEDWQSTFNPTCNSVHELDASYLLYQSAFHLVSSKGFWRNAWRVNVTSDIKSNLNERLDVNATNEFVVLKSLKYVHEPNDETFELSRVDAVSLEQLTKSKFTINIHGFCGTSSLQEFASGDLKGLLPKLEPKEKLIMAMWIAQGVADVHAVGSDKPTKGLKNITRVPSLIHNDINMDNVLLGKRDGVEVPLLNDYNIAVFRKKDANTGVPCPFRGRFANPQWMSPEQQERPGDELSTGYLNEKIDVYALGNILYKVAVGNSPWKADYKTTKITPELKAKIARAKLRGAKPKVPFDIRNNTDVNIKAVLNAMDWCYRNDPNLRPSAAAIANGLQTALIALDADNNTEPLVEVNLKEV